MANPTTNFGWVMPTSTSLVTNLPADFNTFGQGVDTSMAQLKGGTTGQILSKTSATDMAFTWITPNPGDITGVTAGTGLSGGGTSGDVTLSINTAVTADLTTAQTLTNKTLTSPALTTPTISTLTTNGDLLYGTGSGALARRAIGTTGQVLTVSGGVPTWAAAAGGGKVLQVVSATYGTKVDSSTASYVDTGLTATITPTLSTSKIVVAWGMDWRKSSGDASNAVNLKLLRGATAIVTSLSQGYMGSAAFMIGTFAGTYQDSPATTSATTYKIQFCSDNGTPTVSSIPYGANSLGSIVLMEIGA